MVFHWSLSDKSPQFSRTLLSILVDLNGGLFGLVDLNGGLFGLSQIIIIIIIPLLSFSR